MILLTTVMPPIQDDLASYNKDEQNQKGHERSAYGYFPFISLI